MPWPPRPAPLRRRESGRRTRFPAGRWLAYAVLLIAGGYLNELSLLVLAAHAVTVLLARYGRRVLLHWAATAAVSVIAVLPLAALSAREDTAVAWIPRPGLVSLRILFHDYFGVTTAVAVLLFCCAVAAVLPPLERGRRTSAPAWWSQGGVSLPSVAAPLLLVPGVLLILESLVARPLYVDRYVLYGEAGAALLAGAGVLRIGRWLATATGRRMLLWVPGVVVCVAGPGPPARAAAAPPDPAEPPVRLRRAVPVPGRARSAGRRHPVLQQLLPQGPAGLPGGLPERQRLRAGAVARRGRQLPRPRQAGRRRREPDDSATSASG